MILIVAPFCFLTAAQSQNRWCEDQKLLASDGLAGESFGSSVSISEDISIVGAPNKADLGLNSGAAYIYRSSGADTNWVEEQKLLASDGAAHDAFGIAAAINKTAELAVIGATRAFLDQPGKVYVFRYNGFSWVEEDILEASDSPPFFNNFGRAISISDDGNTIIVGASADRELDVSSGAAYVYRFNGTSWVEEQKLLASDGMFNDQFGWSVSIAGDLAIVGAHFEGGQRGSAYIYRFTGSSWIEEQILRASDGNLGDQFGYSVSITDDEVTLIGANGDSSAYVYGFDGTDWIEEQKLVGTPKIGSNENFGWSVSLDKSSKVAAIGAPNNVDLRLTSGPPNGATYIFNLNDNASWELKDKLFASDVGSTTRQFGRSVSLSGDIVLSGDTVDNSAFASRLCLFEPPELPLTIPSELITKQPTLGDKHSSAYFFSGEFYHVVEDLRIPGRGFDFVWSRKYRSRCPNDTTQGNGWDFSYNIWIDRRDRQKIALHDGNSRKTIFTYDSGEDAYVADGFFYSIKIDAADDSFYVIFPDGLGRWNFFPYDGSPEEGKVKEIVDRNGNRLTFSYDALGNLSQIYDTLDTITNPRVITIGYNSDGYISSVSDFNGRSVQYEYYQDGDVDGGDGNLKSVRSPLVQNTPNGNDFPLGKTTVYTYSTESQLLSIKDPKQQTFLTNQYSTDGKLIGQVLGNPGDNIDYHYVELVPDASNNFSSVKAIVNDRVGNVSELFYDERNLLVMRHEYTGRAPDPDAITTDSNNRPTGKLRPADPSFYQTLYSYNDDYKLTEITYPEGNISEYVYHFDLFPSSQRKERGNLREVHRLPGVRGGDQTSLSEFYTHDPNFGSLFDTDFVTRHIDARGNSTFSQYDPNDGNLLQKTHRISSIIENFEYNNFGQLTAHVLPDNGNAHRRRDEFEYYLESDGAEHGYLKKVIVDATNLSLTSEYHYDPVGNLTQSIDPKGHDTQFTINELNQVVRETSREVFDGSSVRYQKDFFYDANDNLIQVDVKNLDELGLIQSNSDISTVYDYDILNLITTQIEEVDESEVITTVYEYDPNRNLTMTRYGEATNGNQTTNTLRKLYDERDLVFQEIQAEGDTEQSTTQYDYDQNRNLLSVSQGLEANPRISSYNYDGYDRKILVSDPMGNTSEYHYDANGNLGGDASSGVPNPFALRVNGELNDVSGSSANVRLYQKQHTYDQMDRLTMNEVEFFDLNTQAPLLDGKSTTQISYSGTSQVLQVLDDNSNPTSTLYDSANRTEIITDAKGNLKVYAYDANSNIRSVSELEKSDLGNPDETYTTFYAYDNLDRVFSTTDNIGNDTFFGYDSRSNRTVVADALNNIRRYEFDGLNRLTKKVIELSEANNANPDAKITTIQNWDHSSRLVEAIDDNGNTTRYGYDPLNRPILTEWADLTAHQVTSYDVHHNPLVTIDPNGTTVTNSYDLLNRLTLKSIVPGQGVSNDTTFESFSYDGLSRVMSAQDDDSEVTLKYDSLSNMTEESLTVQDGTALASTGVTSSAYDGVGNRLTFSYPTSKFLGYGFDSLNRLKTISGVGAIADYSYVGPRRVERRNLLANNTRCDYRYDGIAPNPPDDFGVRKIIETHHSHTVSAATIDRRTYTWDQLYNKLKREDVRIGGDELEHVYNYDSAYRLSESTINSPAVLDILNTGYTLDGVGNRIRTSNGLRPGSYAMSGDNFLLNQYNRTPFDSSRDYDANGNLVEFSTPNNLLLALGGSFSSAGAGSLPTKQSLASSTAESNVKGLSSAISDPTPEAAGSPLDKPPVASLFQQNDVIYDYRNQIVAFGNKDVTANYSYDPFGRRIEKIINANSGTRYFYDQAHVVEEQNISGQVLATYVYGRAIDELISMERGNSSYYYHSDDLGNIMAVSNENGSVLERYDYGDFGEPFPSGPGPVLTSIGNPYFFNGRRYDPETGYYYYRTRYLDPKAGRFVTRDSIGAWGDKANHGNAFTYVNNNPWTMLDPFGLQSQGQLQLYESERGWVVGPFEDGGSRGVLIPYPEGYELGFLDRTRLPLLVDGYIPTEWDPGANPRFDIDWYVNERWGSDLGRILSTDIQRGGDPNKYLATDGGITVGTVFGDIGLSYLAPPDIKWVRGQLDDISMLSKLYADSQDSWFGENTRFLKMANAHRQYLLTYFKHGYHVYQDDIEAESIRVQAGMLEELFLLMDQTELVSKIGSQVTLLARQAPTRNSRPVLQRQVLMAENGSYYGQLNQFGIPKTLLIKGYFTKSGQYRRGYYRAPWGSAKR